MRNAELNINDSHGLGPVNENVIPLEFRKNRFPEKSAAPTGSELLGPHLRIGVLGCGYWGSNYVRIMSGMSGSAVAAIDSCSRTLDRLHAANPAIQPFTDLDTAISNVDALIIATPPATHSDLAVKALSAGKHVLVEKPMALTSHDASRMITAARESQRVLMVGHTFEFNAAIRALRQKIWSGDLGNITHIHSARLRGPYRSDVSVVWDMIPHDISIMNYLLDSRPSVVTASASLNSAGIADSIYIQLGYERVGVVGRIHCSWLAPRKVRDITIVGSKKVAVYDDASDGQLNVFDRVSQQSTQPNAGISEPVGLPRDGSSEPLLVQLRHFFECIVQGTLPQTDGSNGLAVVTVLEAVDQSIAINKPVQVRYSDFTEEVDTRPRKESAGQ